MSSKVQKKSDAKVEKALGAKKAIVKGANATHKKKVRTSVHFSRPKTLVLPKAPKYPRKVVSKIPKMDGYSVIKYPLTTESAMKKIEENNTIVFVVDLKANKNHIKAAVKKQYNIVAAKVNTLVTPKMTKKAFVKLTAEYDALDVANKVGIV
uniref:Ribosomal_L23eN domain-containing protein n=1 Tax=Parastrongyloides trichosuri TaxID=131310 RepID=A0A0N4ZZ19_PARTI